MEIDAGWYQSVVSVPLVLEYESVAKRFVGQSALTIQDVDAIVDYICAQSEHVKIFYLWRPALKDANDDMVLELAAAADCDYIVTFNVKDFWGAQRFGAQPVTPKEFFRLEGTKP